RHLVDGIVVGGGRGRVARMLRGPEVEVLGPLVGAGAGAGTGLDDLAAGRDDVAGIARVDRELVGELTVRDGRVHPGPALTAVLGGAHRAADVFAVGDLRVVGVHADEEAVAAERRDDALRIG